MFINDFSHLDPDILDNTPANCPVNNCDLELTPEDLLAHLLIDHPPNESMTELGSEQYITYDLDIDDLIPNTNHVLGVIAYAKNSDEILGRSISMNHLPLLLMLYASNKSEQPEQFYVLYLVSLEPAHEVSADVIMLFESDVRNISGQHLLRSFLKGPRILSNELLHPNKDCFIYTESDIWKNCTIGDKFVVQFELILHSGTAKMANKKSKCLKDNNYEEETMWMPDEESKQLMKTNCV